MESSARPRLSVILPNYNHADFLPGAVEGLLSQRRQADEIIIIDDGSTDNSAELIADLARAHPTIRAVFLKENRGVVACMNYGLNLAEGDYIYFCAADDRIQSDLFELAIGKLEQHSSAAIFCGEMRLIVPSGVKGGVRPIVRPSETGKFFDPDAVRKLLRGNDQFIATTTAVFRRDHLVAISGFRESLASMADTLCARELALRHGFYFAPSILAEHRISAEGVSRSITQNPEAVLALVSSCRDLVETDPLYPPNYAHQLERRLRFAACRIALAEANDPAPMVLELGTLKRLDRRMLQFCLRTTGGWGRLMTTAWLALRLRPYSLFPLIRTAIVRKFSDAFRAV